METFTTAWAKDRAKKEAFVTRDRTFWIEPDYVVVYYDPHPESVPLVARLLGAATFWDSEGRVEWCQVARTRKPPWRRGLRPNGMWFEHVQDLDAPGLNEHDIDVIGWSRVLMKCSLGDPYDFTREWVLSRALKARQAGYDRVTVRKRR